MTHLIPPTPPASDISRSKLKHIAHWIRDDLDILVAREGPNILRPDDVLILHDLFVALRRSTTITALDLRASGIHKAVKDIAGTATRWPGRLCDECDKIITTWISRFGRFDDLHPFLYGRGGRLEGIASVSEYTREALLKRWSEHCPEKIHSKVSHRLGELGFKAGDWWINPLFAHHAGIIGLESVDGGITFDKKGAYALVLSDMTGIDARCEECFIYRCPINEKGRFRLTAATPTSREPIRVLRSHNINSIWGPKAGIRYEGLYSVVGWCVRQANLKDATSGEWNQGDILYEVTLRRKASVRMEDVARRPTNAEVDDYAEYKRLRKLHHEHKRKRPGISPMPQPAPKAAPPIMPPQLPSGPVVASNSLSRGSPNISRTTTFREPAFNAPKALHISDTVPGVDVVSPMSIPDSQEPFFVPKKSGTLAIPSQRDNDDLNWKSSDTAYHEKHPRVLSPGASSLASSTPSGNSDLKEIIPWLELEAEMTIPSSLDAPIVVRDHTISHSKDRLKGKAGEVKPVKSVRRLARDARLPSDVSRHSQKEGKKTFATSALNLKLYPAKSILDRMKEKGKDQEKEEERKKISFEKSAVYFDGSGYSADEELDHLVRPPTRQVRWMRSSLANDDSQLQSPMPIRTLRANSLFAVGHDLTYSHGIEEIEFTD